MKVTITIENDDDYPGGGKDRMIIIDNGIIGGIITRHFLQRHHTMTVQTTSWPLKVMDDLSGRF